MISMYEINKKFINRNRKVHHLKLYDERHFCEKDDCSETTRGRKWGDGFVGRWQMARLDTLTPIVSPLPEIQQSTITTNAIMFASTLHKLIYDNLQ